jgi:hypothetical protein
MKYYRKYFIRITKFHCHKFFKEKLSYKKYIENGAVFLKASAVDLRTHSATSRMLKSIRGVGGFGGRRGGGGSRMERGYAARYGKCTRALFTASGNLKIAKPNVFSLPRYQPNNGYGKTRFPRCIPPPN